MRFKNPNQTIVNRLYRLVKRIFREDFQEFINKINQRIFYISNKELSAVVVYGMDENKIEIFNDRDSLLTCHSLFSGNEKLLDFYGNNYLSIEPTSIDEESYSGNEKLFSKMKLHSMGDKKVIYLANKCGQEPSPVNNNEALVLIDILEYLLEIKRLFDEGVEALEDANEDCVLCFEFDDEQLLYTSSCVALNSFDFLPKLEFNTRKNVHYIEKLKEFPINQGTLYLGQCYLSSVAECFEYDNKVNVRLNDILLYAATNTGVFTYTLYHTRKTNAKKSLKENLLSIFDRTGLFDLVVTDNYVIYLALFDDLKALNIETKYMPSNRYNGFIYSAIKSFIEFEFDQDIIRSCLNNLKETYPLIMYDIESPQTIFEDEDEFEDEEEDNHDLSSDTSIVS